MMTNDKVIEVYDWFKSAMAGAGRRISLPSDTDPTKTYQYRAIRSFVNKTDDLGIDAQEIGKIVYLIVGYAKKKRLLHHGVSLLNMENIFDICCQELNEQLQQESDVVEMICASKEFLDQQQSLMTKDTRNGYYNITKWYQTGNLPLCMLSVSKRCARALAQLPSSERSEIPSDFDLLRNRISLLGRSNSKSGIIREIMGKDLLTAGL